MRHDKSQNFLFIVVVNSAFGMVSHKNKIPLVWLHFWIHLCNQVEPKSLVLVAYTLSLPFKGECM